MEVSCTDMRSRKEVTYESIKKVKIFVKRLKTRAMEPLRRTTILMGNQFKRN